MRLRWDLSPEAAIQVDPLPCVNSEDWVSQKGRSKEDVVEDEILVDSDASTRAQALRSRHRPDWPLVRWLASGMLARPETVVLEHA